MLFRKKELSPTLVEQMKDYVHDIIGLLIEVHKKLPCGFPEYIYQEALEITLNNNDIAHHKEFIYHPTFDDKQLNSYLRMDFMIERNMGNIIIECKAIEQLGEKERYQLFSYMIGTSFPIGILVNFATYPKAQIEKYYFDKTDGTITPF